MESNSATEKFQTPLSRSSRASSLNDFNSKGLKNKMDIKMQRNSYKMLDSSGHGDLQRKRQKTYTKPLDPPDPFSIDVLKELDYSSLSRYGSVAKEIEDLITRKISMNHTLACKFLNVNESLCNDFLNTKGPTSTEVIILDDDDNDEINASGELLLSAKQAEVPLSRPLIILDSDDEDSTLMKSADDRQFEIPMEDAFDDKQSLDDKDEKAAAKVEHGRDKCLYVDEENDTGMEEGCEKCPYVALESDNYGKIAGDVELTEYKGEKSHCYGIENHQMVGPSVEIEDDKDEKVSGEPELTEDKGEESPCVCIKDDRDEIVAHEAFKGVYIGIKDDTGPHEGCEKGPYVGIEGDIDEKDAGADEISKGKGEYVGVEEDTETEENDDQTDENCDGLGDIWKEMRFVMECSKVLSAIFYFVALIGLLGITEYFPSQL